MLRPVGYREYPPGPALSDIVECFWTVPGGSTAASRILPDGCMDLVFDLSGTAGAAAIGAMRLPRLAQATNDLVGVRFRPGGLTALFRLDASLLTDGRCDLALLWPDARLVWNRLGETPPAARIAVLAAALRGLRQRPADALARHCIRAIEASRGRIAMAQLSASAGVGIRRIERHFAQHVGLSAKRFARVVRFQSVLARLSRQEPDWADVAIDCGYADQPHLVREFKELSGLTPAAAVANLQDERKPHR
jgi:AraC-like DNA-binding protein